MRCWPTSNSARNVARPAAASVWSIGKVIETGWLLGRHSAWLEALFERFKDGGRQHRRRPPGPDEKVQSGGGGGGRGVGGSGGFRGLEPPFVTGRWGSRV